MEQQYTTGISFDDICDTNILLEGMTPDELKILFRDVYNIEFEIQQIIADFKKKANLLKYRIIARLIGSRSVFHDVID